MSLEAGQESFGSPQILYQYVKTLPPSSLPTFSPSDVCKVCRRVAAASGLFEQKLAVKLSTLA